ncbi:MAG: DUF2298 domain-containing protein [Acidobacteriota bacterium]
MKSQVAVDDAVLGPQTRTRSSIRSYPWTLSVAAVLGLMLLIVGIHRNSPRTLISFHGYLHAAVTERFLAPNSTSVPPENPFYAGQPLPYYWFFHFLAAQVSRLTGWNVFFALETMVLTGAALLGIGCLLLARRLFRRVTLGLLTVYLVLVGTNPFGIVLAGLKVLVQGTQRLKDDPNFLWNVVHPIYTLIRYNDSGGVYGQLIGFFLNMTSRPLALGSLMVSLVCLEWVLAKPRIVPLACLALAFGFTTAASPIIGVTAGGVLCGFLLLVAVLPLRFLNRLTGTTRATRRSNLRALSAISVGIILAAPTFLHLLTGPSDNRPDFYLFSGAGLKHLITLALGVSVLLLLAAIGYITSAEENRGFFRLLILGALALLFADAAIQLPSLNNSNFFHAAVVFLAVPATGSVVLGRRAAGTAQVSFRATAAIVLLFLPTSVLFLGAYVARPPLPVDFSEVFPRRLPADSPLSEFYDWARVHTRPEAVLILNPEHRLATNGNVLEVPAMTNRAIFTELPDHYMAPYPDAPRRFDIARRLTSGRETSPEDREYLRQLRRPVYVVATKAGREAKARLERQFGFPVFSAGKILVFSVQGY